MEYRKSIDARDKSVLIISDTHFPYSHQDTIPFLAEIKRTLNPSIITHSGDETDGHQISFHSSDSSLFNADKELERAIEDIAALAILFPKMVLCESNHGSLIYRRLKAEGIPLSHLKSLQDLYGVPEWSWHHEILLHTHLGLTLLVHGKSGAYNKLSQVQGCNAIQGHHHSKFEITWINSTTGPKFNMIVGCLIDPESMAFEYGKNLPNRPILGCGYLDSDGEPYLLRMKLDKHNRWVGKL